MSDSFERIVGRLCVEKGWINQAQLDLCESDLSRTGGRLSEALAARGWVTAALLEELRQVFEKAVTPAADPVARRKEDALLGQLLVAVGGARREHVAEAFRIQRYIQDRSGHTPTIQQVLMERGWAKLDTIRLALRHMRNRTLLECGKCRQKFWAMGYEPGKKYLCGACAGTLFRWGGSPDVPEAVRRAASDPLNLMGKYVAVAPVGRGGMGVVYRGWDTALRRWVALKVLTAGVSSEDVARFWREAQVVAALRHPGIVNIYDVFSDGGRHVIAMDLVEGDCLAGKKFPPREAARIVAEVARALAHAHAKGVIHRDIKPHNILLDRTGRPFLTDFGLAKQVKAASGGSTAGAIVGTPMYMSPEQAQGLTERIDARSDVYMLGAVLYEALTGRPPFLGLDAYDTIQRVVEESVTPPSRLNPAVPRELEAIVMRCLEKDRERRYASARELAEELERYRSGPEPPPARKTTRRFLPGAPGRHVGLPRPRPLRRRPGGGAERELS